MIGYSVNWLISSLVSCTDYETLACITCTAKYIHYVLSDRESGL